VLIESETQKVQKVSRGFNFDSLRQQILNQVKECGESPTYTRLRRDVHSVV